MTIEKVYDELVSMIADLQKKSGGGGSGNLSVQYVTEYVQPEPDTIYIILGSTFDVQAAYIMPKDSQIVYTLVGDIPSGTMTVLDDTYTDFLKEPVVLSVDDASTIDFTNKYIQLRSGGGTFYSWFKCITMVDKAFYEKIQLTYTFQNETYDDEVNLSSLLESGDRMFVGFYYNTDNSGCRVGIAFWPELTPELLHTYQLKSGTGASGNIRISKFALV